MTSTATSLPQTRHLATAVPGPRSQALHLEREAQVTTGFGVALPVFVERADGGILQDVDGNRFIDFASGIAVTSVGAANPKVQAREVLEPLLDESDAVADVRGRGAMLAVEFSDPGTLEPRPDLAAAIAKRCHQQGVLTLVCGTYGNVIRLLPPLVIGEVLLRGLAVLRHAILAESPALAGSAAR